MDNLTIAIDGPAGAGKSTVGKILAERLKLLYLDTGAMYRTVALALIQKGVNPEDAALVVDSLDTIHICVEYENGSQRMYLDNCDVTDKIRSPEIAKAASAVATIPQVRYKLVDMQRAIAKRQPIILDGRDIGTFVLPNADIKFYIEASLEERGRRRWMELCGLKDKLTLSQVIEDIRARDINDSSRDVAPLARSVDSIAIDTTDKSIEDVVDEMLLYINKKYYNDNKP